MKDLHSMSNSWQTPDWLFKELNEEFHFDIDLCATKENSKCSMYYSDYLNDVQLHTRYFPEVSRTASLRDLIVIGGKTLTCFMNPPYSNPKPFIEKAWEDSKYCKIIVLVKCDPSTKWWATFWDYEKKERVYMVKYKECIGCGKYDWCQGIINYTTDPCGGWSGRKILCEKISIYSGPKSGCEVRFFPKRIKFDPPPGGKVEHTSGPTFSSALLIFDRRDINETIL